MFRYALFVLGLLAVSCANQKPPTGGEKDEEPPELVVSVPEQEQRNFKGKEITLEFNELVKTESAKEQIIITPRITGEYEIKYRKNKVIIEFEDPLNDSTTYTLNFREGIKDLNEGNPPENLKLAFSTGEFLDSLQITGRVYNLLTNEPIDDVTISLYEVADTLNPFDHPPIYFTKSNEKGQFQFDNLKSSDYQIVALSDKNKNLIIDPKNERYGFLKDTLSLSQNIDSLKIPMQLLDVRPLVFQSGRQSGTTYNLKFNKYLEDYDLTNYDDLTFQSNYVDKSQNTIQIFNNQLVEDSIFLFIEAYDTLYNRTVDTTYVKFEETNRDPKEFTFNSSIEAIIPATGKLTASAKFNKPISYVNFDSIYIYLDSANRLPLDSSHITFNKHKDELDISYILDSKYFEKSESDSITTNHNAGARQPKAPPPTKGKGTRPNPKTLSSDSTEIISNEQDTSTVKQTTPPKPELKPHLYFGHSAFISTEQDSSKTTENNLQFTDPASLGILLVEIQTTEQSFIVQLLNKQNHVVREVKNEKTFAFKNVKPADYKIRILVDTNQNGRWDPGNIMENREPEPVVFFKNSEGQLSITLRANWEVGPSIISF